MLVDRARFEKLAEGIVNAAYGHGDLSTEVAKVAVDLGLPPEAIKTLLQMVNTIASLKHFEESDDRSEPFELAQPDKVLKIVFHVGDEGHGEATHQCESCEDHNAHDSYDHDDYSTPPESSGDVKVASTMDAELSRVAEKLEASKLATYSNRSSALSNKLRIRGVLKHFRNKLAWVEQEYVDNLDTLASEFARLHGPDLAPFEKRACAVFDAAAFEPLANIRDCLRLPRVDYAELAKLASQEIAVVDDTTREFSKLARMIELNEIHVVLGNAVDDLVNVELNA